MVAKRTVQATITSLSLLEAVVQMGPIGVTSLSNELDMPKSTVHKHLSTLSDLGYVHKAGQAYLPSIRLSILGEQTKHHKHLYQVSKIPIQGLAESIEEHSGLYIADGPVGTPVYTTRGQRALLDENDHELTTYLHSNAAGKAILAHASEELQEAVIERGLPAHTDQTITERAVLQTEIEDIAERSVAFDRGEQHPDLRSVAVPLKTDLPAAVYVLAPINRMRGKRFEEDLPGLITNAVQRIEEEYNTVHNE